MIISFVFVKVFFFFNYWRYFILLRSLTQSEREKKSINSDWRRSSGKEIKTHLMASFPLRCRESKITGWRQWWFLSIRRSGEKKERKKKEVNERKTKKIRIKTKIICQTWFELQIRSCRKVQCQGLCSTSYCSTLWWCQQDWKVFGDECGKEINAKNRQAYLHSSFGGTMWYIT